MRSLFEESKISGMKVKNRFVRSATWENMATESGHMTDELYCVYRKLAENEVGMIITGYANIVKEEQPNPGMMGIYDDTFIEEYQKLTDMVHNYESKIILQLAYGGTKTTFNTGSRVIFAPSEVPEKATGTQGKAMTKTDIEYIVDAFAKAAKRAKDSGFDGVEIHGAHTYLINQFLSPYYNRRTDEYGGSLENRMRFLKEIYFEMRNVVGKDFPIMVKLTATDFFDGGQSFEDTRIICRELERLGIDAIELSGNIHGKARDMVGQSFDGYRLEKEGYFVNYGNVISEELDIPVITVGGLTNFDTIHQLLQQSNIAYFAIARPLLAEPNLIKRWLQGDKADAKCVRCSKCRTSEGNYCTVFQKTSRGEINEG
ncbi:MAG: NADH:flavin oxidoreductase [Erysipelotrichaceae bacterium]